MKSERCKFLNRGYCKYIHKGCKYFHPQEICSSYSCNGRQCFKRHPKTCKFGQTCQYKQNCMYKHFNEDKNKVNSFENGLKQKDSIIQEK